MAIGWLANTAAADTYFVTRYGSDSWAALTDANKTSLLTTSYNRIRFSKQFDIPGSPSGTVLEKLQIAQEELAWYMYIHIEDEDRRKGIQAQGVIGAGVVQENYYAEMLQKIPFPPVVLELLDDLKKYKGLHFVDIDRKEPCSVDEDVDESDNSYNIDGVY